MADLANVLPDIIFYLVSGFFFMQIFNLTYVHRSISNYFVPSLVVGFVIVNAFNLIPFSFNKSIDSFGIAMGSIVLGYACGRIASLQKLNILFDELHINNTLHPYFWDDALDYDYPAEMKISMNGKVYEGIVRLLEEETANPKVMLIDFAVDGHKQEQNQGIILDIGKADEVVISYDSESPMMGFIKHE